MRFCIAYILLIVLACASCVLLTDAGSMRRVASGEELGAALLATDVEFVVLTSKSSVPERTELLQQCLQACRDEHTAALSVAGKIRLSREVWVPGGTAVIGHNRRVVLQSGKAHCRSSRPCCLPGSAAGASDL